MMKLTKEEIDLVSQMLARIKTLEDKVDFLESWRSFVLQMESINRKMCRVVPPPELQVITSEEWDRRNGL
jgi:hypothetical protein